MTPQEIYMDRFCLRRPPPAGVNTIAKMKDDLVRQLEAPVPNLFDMATWQEVSAFKSSGLKGAERTAAQASLRYDNASVYWNPLLAFCQKTDRPFLARLMLDVPNSAPTSETQVRYTYVFWAGLHSKLLSTHGDWLCEVILGQNLYRRYLNADENIGPNSARGKKKGSPPPDENLAREMHEILSTGPDVVEQDGPDMNETALLLSGLRSGGFDPADQEPGDRVILGKRIAFRPDESMIEEYLRWIAVHPMTARTQCARLVEPLLGKYPGGNYTPALQEHLEQTWIKTGGDRRKVLQAMVMHDDAWNPNRGAPVNSLVGFVKHMNENNIPMQGMNWKDYLGYQFERAPDPEGLPMDERLIGASFLLHRTKWPGTTPQRLASMHYTRVVV